jgi:hypothetical protein
MGALLTVPARLELAGHEPVARDLRDVVEILQNGP